MNIIFATQNKGKAEEVKSIFKEKKFTIISLYDLGDKIEIEETGTTLRENAVLKAKTIYDIYKVPVVADDSGLEIKLLDGRPGVYSARYAGEGCTFDDNNRKVIEELKEFKEPYFASFFSYAVFYDGSNLIEAIGELPGRIITEFRGTNGFGYDPIFVPDGYDQTIAELSLEEKNKISHRAKSFNKIHDLMINMLG